MIDTVIVFKGADRRSVLEAASKNTPRFGIEEGDPKTVTGFLEVASKSSPYFGGGVRGFQKLPISHIYRSDNLYSTYIYGLYI